MKTFNLPKEFAEKWLVALKTGDYSQASNTLLDASVNYDSGDIDHIIGYCCLGVACSILGANDDELLNKDIIFQMSNIPDEIPQILAEENSDFNLVDILTRLNDGFTSMEHINLMEQYEHLWFNRLPSNTTEKISYSFKEIAEWIEHNVDLI